MFDLLKACALLLGFCAIVAGHGLAEEPAKQMALADQDIIAFGKKLSGACQRCHGVNGLSRDLARPNLAGQSEAYLRKQLLDFRKAFRVETLGLSDQASASLARRHPDMSERAGRLNDMQVEALAAYYAAQPCASDGRAEVISKPALAENCDTCHSVTGKDNRADIPRIHGQNRDYLIRQLIAFREGDFVPRIIDRDSSRMNDTMSRKAQALNNTEIATLSAYYAASPCQVVPD